MEKKVIDFVGKRAILFFIPIVFIIATIIGTFVFGVDMSIEFKGGTMLTYSYEGEVNTNDIKATVEGQGFGAVTVITGSAVNGSLETVQVSFSSAEGLTADVQTELTNKLKETYKDNKLELINSQDVNPTSGFEFFLKCTVAVLFSFVLLVIYIAFRFKNIGGLSAGIFSLVALMHDIILVYAVFVFCGFPIDANFMAVVLTILGNSINNTIVVYDRVRENRNLYGESLSLKELMNLSTTQSVTRAINTTLTTAFAVITICVVCAICGVTSIMTFAIPMAAGLVFGTYSSLCIAGPLWVLWQEKRGKGGKKSKKSASKMDSKKIMV